MAKFSDVLLTADFDRTLTDTQSQVPQRNLEAIRYFMENGGAFTVNTGRGVPVFAQYMDAVEVNAPLLMYNGSAAYDKADGKLSFCHPIQLDQKMFLDALIARFPELTVEVEGVDVHYAFAPNPGWKEFMDYNRCAYQIAKTGDDLGPFLKVSLYGTFHDCTVASFFEGWEEETTLIEAAQAYIRETYGHAVEVYRASLRSLDIHAKGTSKLKSARELQQQLGRKILVCVGDADNDLSMLLGADYAFCPADGVVADRFPNVCPCDEGAVADVIYKKIPEILAKEP